MTILSLKNVSLNLPGKDKPIINDLSYEIKRGDFIILLGSNGSGKSTLFKLLSQQLSPAAGQITFKGKNIASLNQHYHEALFNSLTLYENYLLFKKTKLLFTRHQLERAFLKNYLYDFNPNLCEKLNCAIQELSGGEKQAFALALCLLKPPSVLLLDEHTSALDPKTSDQIMQLTQKQIKKHQMTCVLTTHNLDIAMEYGNRILMLKEGSIFKMINKNEDMVFSKESLALNY